MFAKYSAGCTGCIVFHTGSAMSTKEKKFDDRCRKLEKDGFQMQESSPFAHYAKFVNASGETRTIGTKPLQ